MSNNGANRGPISSPPSGVFDAALARTGGMARKTNVALDALRRYVDITGAAPCVLSGCGERCVEGRALCAKHELRFIAKMGISSPPLPIPDPGGSRWYELLTTRDVWHPFE